MTIVDKIIRSIQVALSDEDTETPFPVYYHDESTLNIETADMEFPCALFQLLTTGTVERDSGTAKERVTAAVFFVEKSDFDFDAKENEVIIDRCKGRAFRWLLTLNTDPAVNLYSLNRTSRVYDRYDDCLTGYGVFVELTEIEGICINNL